ncbi:hypothetical protein OG21DRAFT_360501 [Imleria badia]|nr:hypothetical protein OG21DRAFT_360501 [Imleria badia]
MQGDHDTTAVTSTPSLPSCVVQESLLMSYLTYVFNISLKTICTLSHVPLLWIIYSGCQMLLSMCALSNTSDDANGAIFIDFGNPDLLVLTRCIKVVLTAHDLCEVRSQLAETRALPSLHARQAEVATLFQRWATMTAGSQRAIPSWRPLACPETSRIWYRMILAAASSSIVISTKGEQNDFVQPHSVDKCFKHIL